MSFTGRWSVTVEDWHGDGSHAPADESEIAIFEVGTGGGYYLFCFTPRTTEIPHAFTLAKDDANPDQLVKLLVAAEVGYTVQAKLHLSDNQQKMRGQLGFVHPLAGGNEDNDTATFTATKKRPPEERP